MLSNIYKRIYLVGFMGSGKTTFGRELSAALQLDFVDLDAAIENTTNQKIATIFEENGENFFREIEKNTLQKCNENTVIATGGGTACFFDNMQWMKENGLVIYLNNSTEVLLERLNKTDLAERPLLKNLSKESLQLFVKEKLAEREKYYFLADIFINNNAITAQEVANWLKN